MDKYEVVTFLPGMDRRVRWAVRDSTTKIAVAFGYDYYGAADKEPDNFNLFRHTALEVAGVTAEVLCRIRGDAPCYPVPAGDVQTAYAAFMTSAEDGFAYLATLL